jgi:hypothetical protein
MSKNVVLLLCGAVGAGALVVACGDDSPGDADAAACTCAPSEPPLAGRIVRVEDRRTASTPVLSATAVCAPGATLLGGGCYLEGAGNVRLISNGDPRSEPGAWTCYWLNESGPNDVTVVAWATCLLPTP